MASDDLREQIAAAIRSMNIAAPLGFIFDSETGDAAEVLVAQEASIAAEAVRAVVQPELDRLRDAHQKAVRMGSQSSDHMLAAIGRAEKAEADRDEARAALTRVEALATKRDVLYPTKFGRTPSENYVMGYRSALADLRAALRTPDGGSDE